MADREAINKAKAESLAKGAYGKGKPGPQKPPARAGIDAKYYLSDRERDDISIDVNKANFRRRWRITRNFALIKAMMGCRYAEASPFTYWPWSYDGGRNRFNPPEGAVYQMSLGMRSWMNSMLHRLLKEHDASSEDEIATAMRRRSFSLPIAPWHASWMPPSEPPENVVDPSILAYDSRGHLLRRKQVDEIEEEYAHERNRHPEWDPDRLRAMWIERAPAGTTPMKYLVCGMTFGFQEMVMASAEMNITHLTSPGRAEEYLRAHKPAPGELADPYVNWDRAPAPPFDALAILERRATEAEAPYRNYFTTCLA